MLIDAGLCLYYPTFWGPKKFSLPGSNAREGRWVHQRWPWGKGGLPSATCFKDEKHPKHQPSMLMFTMLPRFWPIPASKVDIKVWNDVGLSANRITTNPMVYHHGSHYCLFFYEYPTVVTAGFSPLQIPKDMWTLPEGLAWESPGAPAGDVHLMVKEKWPNMEIME